MIRYILVPTVVPRALEVGVGQETLIARVRLRLRTDDYAG